MTNREIQIICDFLINYASKPQSLIRGCYGGMAQVLFGSYDI